MLSTIWTSGEEATLVAIVDDAGLVDGPLCALEDAGALVDAPMNSLYESSLTSAKGSEVFLSLLGSVASVRLELVATAGWTGFQNLL